MVNRCYICKIASYKEEAQNLSFHRLPRDPIEKRIWLSCLGFNEQDVFPKSVLICSRHFRETDLAVGLSGRRYLKPNVVPLPRHSVFRSPGMSSKSSDTTICPAIPSDDNNETRTMNKREAVEENIEQCYYLPGPSSQVSTIEHMVVQDCTTQSTGIQQLSSPSSTTLSASAIETVEATAALTTSKRKRKYYAGDLTSSDFSSPNKAKKNYRILKTQLITQRKKIHSLQSTVISFRKKVKNLNQLLKLLKKKSYITESSEFITKQ